MRCKGAHTKQMATECICVSARMNLDLACMKMKTKTELRGRNVVGCWVGFKDTIHTLATPFMSSSLNRHFLRRREDAHLKKSATRLRLPLPCSVIGHWLGLVC
eukprot:scaffold3736_cov119-Skeletonema_menzelii.AAC.4